MSRCRDARAELGLGFIELLGVVVIVDADLSLAALEHMPALDDAERTRRVLDDVAADDAARVLALGARREQHERDVSREAPHDG